MIVDRSIVVVCIIIIFDESENYFELAICDIHQW